VKSFSCKKPKEKLLTMPISETFVPKIFTHTIFCPPKVPLGVAVIWKSSMFVGHLSFSNEYAISVYFTSTLNNESWLLTAIDAPCTYDEKRAFIDWFRNVQMPPDINWIVVRDFNLIRRPENRNREGADTNEMFMFNEAISRLDLIELPLHGSQFTWTNKQFEPLLERLDWFFTSNSWTLKYPNTLVKSW
jgi:hypothetical protein